MAATNTTKTTTPTAPASTTSTSTVTLPATNTAASNTTSASAAGQLAGITLPTLPTFLGLPAAPDWPDIAIRTGLVVGGVILVLLVAHSFVKGSQRSQITVQAAPGTNVQEAPAKEAGKAEASEAAEAAAV
jgi:hypothetical protein